MTLLLCILIVSLSAGISLAATYGDAHQHNVIAIVWCAQSVVWGFLIWRIASATSYTSRTRWVLLASLAASMIVLFPATDVLSDDAHRYRWDGWVQTHGINPYRAAPADPALASIHHRSDGVSYPESINNNTLQTIYPPGAQHVFACIVRCCGTSPLGFKSGWIALCALIIAASVIMLWSNDRLLALYLAVLLSPIYLLHGMMDIHVDIVMGLVVMLSFIAMQRTGWASKLASSIYGYAITLKYLPLLLLPAFVQLRASSKKEKLQRILIITATIALLYMPFISANVLGSLGAFTSAWQANSLLAWIGNLVFDPSITRIVLMLCAAVMMLGIVITWREHLLWCCSMIVLTLMVFSPVVHAWYIALPLMLWILAPSRTPIVWGVSMCVYGLTYANYKGNGVWFDNPVALGFEYIPVMIAFAIDVWRGPLLLRDQHGVSLTSSSDR